MPELNMISPLLTNMELVKCVSVHGGTSVYIVKSTKSNQSYYLKHICIPESQKQVDALMLTGAAATVEDAQNYYKQVAADYQAELETLEKLSASPNIGCYRSYQIEPKEDGVGFEIYLLAEYRQTLSEVLAETPMTQSGEVKIGKQIGCALCSLREAGLIHRNVKPSNVYLSSSGHYLLGDLGIAKIDELKYCSMPETMLSSFSAPELFSLLGTIEPTTDIYSVGMILYRIYNGNHGPFEDEKTSARAADKLRVTGEQLPAPMYADYEMADIVLKACAFKPEDRYQTPQELQEALLEYGKRNEASDALIVVSNSHCIIPCVSPMPSVTWLMTPDNGRFTMIAPNPIGRSSAGSYSFLTASQIKSPPIRYITTCCGVIAMTPSHKNSMLFLLLILFSFINILFPGVPCQDTPALAAVFLRARYTSM